jgi:C4-dicarboxylate transporter DctQ subunit
MPNASIPTMPARESVLTRANSLLDWLEVNFIGAALIMAAGLLFVNVVLRYVFLAPIGWAEEFSLYTIVWIVFIGGSVAIRTRGHIAIDLLMLVLPAQGRRLLLIFVGLVTLVFLAVFFYYSGLHVLRTKSSGQVMPALQAPMWLAYLAMPVGSVLMFLRTLQMLLKTLRSDAETPHAMDLND